jgi:hypothetical protein
MTINMTRHADLQTHFAALEKELTTYVEQENEDGEIETVAVPPNEHAFEIVKLIVMLRRGIDVKNNTIRFSTLMTRHFTIIIPNLTTRWLVSITDTMADYMEYGGANEALLVSQYVNLIKLGQTYINHCGDYVKPDKYMGRELWDGVTEYMIDGGDMPTNLYRRINNSIKNPVIKKIFNEVRMRQYGSDNFMARMKAL